MFCFTFPNQNPKISHNLQNLYSIAILTLRDWRQAIEKTDSGISVEFYLLKGQSWQVNELNYVISAFDENIYR